jgi:hypothetical protein
VGLRPLDHEPPSPRRELTGDDFEALDVHRGLVVAVGGVEVRLPRWWASSWYIQITIP